MTVDPAVPGAPREFDVVLVLSGGNALGAFEAGVYEALHERGLQPDWIIGASIGAINGALIVGSPPDRRIDTLRIFWRPNTLASVSMAAALFPPAAETGRRSTAVAWTAAAGRSGIFGPLLSSSAPWTDNRPALFETNQLAATLERLVDVDRLNDGSCRFTATAVDLETGNDVVFDSLHRRIEPDHIRASAALPVVFPPVEIDGWWMAGCRQTCRSIRFSPIRRPGRRCASRSTFFRYAGRCRPRSGGSRSHAGFDLRCPVPPHDRAVAGHPCRPR